ncbi:hypothetical protein [uncultured Clostridium sp.]|uniref:hypothetical protein n=1 Tax=uncultured Clostridium sp. TaxID=59620 RepID=UPI00261D7A33|nr:hypothetical protein [uncultured Clostridium sp.]
MDELEKCLCEIKNLEKQMDIHFEYIEKMFVAEAKRIDANRANDISEVALANDKAIAQSGVLSSQFANINKQIEERIIVLEKNNYENEGRKTFSAPLLITIASLMGGIIVYIVQKLISL